ncbi:hypothetical protein HZC35_03820 [Candidatus Saganbacteria bacterium]|nr:hypothetical protein [Candidatus Saganbacteria bacterium]
MKKIIFLPNGHGEDQVAAEILKLLPNTLDITVLPLVGDGKIFDSLPVKVIGPRKIMPSGGFSARNLWTLPLDLYSGLFGTLREQWKILEENRGKFDLAVGIGDLVPLLACKKIKSPFVFVGVNKSDYYHTFSYSYTPWEKWLLKSAVKVYARDRVTAEHLKVEYAGNPLMDTIGIPGLLYREQEVKRVVGFLPGTREADVPKNLEDFERIVKVLQQLDRNFKFLIALKQPKLLVGPTPFEVRPFADVIYGSDIVIGLSGTGNEQAAGLGKPIVAFPGRGAQYNRRFARAQQELLDGALALVERDPKKVADEAWEILTDQGRYNYMSREGKLRMGEAGAIPKISRDIVKLLS